MTKDEFIEYLDGIGARYQDLSDIRPIETIFVFGKDEYDKVKKHPRKNKNLYIPYIRISWHWDTPEVLYTRWNGETGYMTEEQIKDIVGNGKI